MGGFVGKNAAVLWTGGKDSALAFYEAREAGYTITHLVTFVPRNRDFIAHPLRVIQQQARSIGLPHVAVEIAGPMKEGYEKAIDHLKKHLGINTVITGDIAEVHGYPNWIRECSNYSGINVYTPLWGLDRNKLIARLLSLHFRVIFTCVKKPWFTHHWAGKTVTKDSWRKLRDKNNQTGLDVCGENGEFHTMVLDAPYFKKSIQIKVSSKQKSETMTSLNIQDSALHNK